MQNLQVHDLDFLGLLAHIYMTFNINHPSYTKYYDYDRYLLFACIYFDIKINKKMDIIYYNKRMNIQNNNTTLLSLSHLL